MSLSQEEAVKQQDRLIAKGRLTSGNAPLHERRKNLANAIIDAQVTLKIMITNWPNEFELPEGHDVFQLMEVMGVVAEDLTNVEQDTEMAQGTNS